MIYELNSLFFRILRIFFNHPTPIGGKRCSDQKPQEIPFNKLSI